MYILEILMVFFYVISIIVTTYPTLTLNKDIREWIFKIENSAKNGIIDVSNLSNKNALKSLQSIFLYICIISFVTSVIYEKILNQSSFSLFIVIITSLYFFASIRAWIKNKNIILRGEFINFKKYFFQILIVLIFFFILIVVLLYYNEINTENAYSYLSLSLLIIFIISIVTSSILSGSSLIFIFLPAILTITYLIFVVYTFKLISKFNKVYLKNILVFYFIIYTIVKLIMDF